MPLRDHFHDPLDKITVWEALHGQWPAMIVIDLSAKLPARYVAEPRVHRGAEFEIDVSAYEKDEPIAPTPETDTAESSVATAVWAPASHSSASE